MFDQGDTDLRPAAKQKGKNTFGQIALPDGLLHRLTYQFAGAGMSRMGFDDDRTSRR